MAIARSTKETFDYILEADRALSPAEQTVFQLRRLSNAIMLALENLTTVDSTGGSIAVRTGDAKALALHAGVAGWRNLRDEKGNEVPFKAHEGRKLILGVALQDPASSESLERLRVDDLKELAGAIFAGNQVTVADAKN
jgi:hypothetical protein